KGTPPCAKFRYGKCVLQLNNWALNDLINNPSSVSKNKRITQKTKLREVLTCLENGSNPSFKHKLTTWCAILKHQKLSQVIGQNLEA
ncbi:hypothetical protein Bhyg_11923, partial [Pseudolycoriella hygida]